MLADAVSRALSQSAHTVDVAYDGGQADRAMVGEVDATPRRPRVRVGRDHQIGATPPDHSSDVPAQRQAVLDDAVVVAASPGAAAELTGIPVPPTKPLTTFWHTAPAPPSRAKLLHVDGARRGPLVNTAVLTNVAPGYAPPGRVLIASSTVAADSSATAEADVRRQAGLVYGVGPAAWELITSQVITAALPHQPPPLVLRRPARLDSGVFVAGDHRDTASIQGALVSGRRVADAITGGPAPQ